MSFKDRWFAEYERHMDEQVSMGLDWDQASAYAAMRADAEAADALAAKADMLNDWERDEAALGSIEDA
jgi:hypothetical protein